MKAYELITLVGGSLIWRYQDPEGKLVAEKPESVCKGFDLIPFPRRPESLCEAFPTGVAVRESQLLPCLDELILDCIPRAGKIVQLP